MEIFVNEIKLENEMENEKNLNEIVDQVSLWIEKNGKFIVSCRVDGEEFTKDIGQKEISDAGRLDFYVGEELDILRSTLDELDSYIEKVGNTLFGRDSLTEQEATELRDGVEWMVSVLQSAASLLQLDLTAIKPLGQGNTVQEILENLSSLSQSEDSSQAIEEFLENLRDLKLFSIDLMSRTSVLDMDPDTLKQIISGFTNGIPALKEELVRINENYQAGKDEVAIQVLNHAVSQINMLLTALISVKSQRDDIDFGKIQIGESSFDEECEKMNETLASIAVSLEENDIIQAGDIVEYELPAVLDDLIPFLKELEKLL